ncbi:MAG: hypothetical protein RMJ28_07060 [Nitrososphaerota archaeon]|nr:hypothetical protein [Nitrososphaerota archaeon]
MVLAAGNELEFERLKQRCIAVNALHRDISPREVPAWARDVKLFADRLVFSEIPGCREQRNVLNRLLGDIARFYPRMAQIKTIDEKIDELRRLFI